MAGSVNKVILVGRLGRDPESRTLQNGNKVVNLNIATDESWKDKATGERKTKTEWHRVVVFGPNADFAEKYCKKGGQVYLSGALQTRKWTDQAGAEKYTTEVVLQNFGGELTMLDSPKRDSEDAAPRAPAASNGSSRGRDLDDDIPFAPEVR